MGRGDKLGLSMHRHEKESLMNQIFLKNEFYRRMIAQLHATDARDPSHDREIARRIGRMAKRRFRELQRIHGKPAPLTELERQFLVDGK